MATGFRRGIKMKENAIKPIIYSLKNFYTEKINNLTLVEVLEIYYSINPQFTPWHKYNSEIAKKLVKAHDITHIVFGCDTTLLGEMRVQLWTKFGVKSFSWKETLNYARDKESRVLIMNPIGYYAMFIFFIKHLSEVWKVKQQTKLLYKKWEYFEEDKYMAKTIGEIRKEYNIQIVA
jgi:ubiquinone biosynthesis protein Coq4